MKNCKHPTCENECRRKKTKVKNEHPRLLAQAQEAVNAFVRRRDRNKPCICGCGNRVEQAGHYYPAGSYSGVRFDEVNIHGIARICNYFKDTTAIDPEYEVGLIARVGLGAVNDLKARAEATRHYKWSREELKAIINKYKKPTNAIF
jgi:hypothetical protein